MKKPKNVQSRTWKPLLQSTVEPRMYRAPTRTYIVQLAVALRIAIACVHTALWPLHMVAKEPEQHNLL